MSVAAAFLILAAAGATPVVASQCPASTGAALVYVDIFDGPPDEMADLVPDQHSSPADKTAWNVWRLEAGPNGLYVKCGYGRKLEGPYSRIETIRLPDAVKTCRADFRTGPKPADLTLLKFACQ